MPVSSKHQSYLARKQQWQRIRDVDAGSDAVKERGSLYLRRPDALDHWQFNEYVRSAEFHGATGRTIDGLVGAIFRRDPVVTMPSRFEQLLVRTTPEGTPSGPTYA